MRVLGVDPGLRCLGWGVVEATGAQLGHVAHGECRSGAGSLAERLAHLHAQLAALIDEHTPDMAALEQTFVSRDGAATLKLGQARGVALLALAQAGLEVGEYAPNAVKKTVVGVGHADKRQIAYMVGLQLPGAEGAGTDAADALAVALCHVYHARSSGRIAAAVARARA